MDKIWNEVYEEFRDYGVKPATATAYQRGLKRFCTWLKEAKDLDVDANTLLDLGINRIEKLTQKFIRRNETVLSPKYLNVIYCSIKRWVTIKELIKTARMFKEIKFDKSSRKVEALTETALKTEHLRNAFKVATLEKKIDLGLYGLCGLRPSIIPEIRVKWIYEENRTIEDGKLTLKKPCILIIPRVNPRTKKPLQGNKGNITFMSFMPSQLCELIELRLNNNHAPVTLETRISASPTETQVYYHMKTVYEQVGFKGRPYLLRSYANNLLDRITHQFNEKNFKEFLMGHKGDISAKYQFRQLNDEEEEKYRAMYTQACDKWINEHIFEQRSQTEMDKASAVIMGLKASGLTFKDSEIKAILEQFEIGKLTFEQFNQTLSALAQDAFNMKLKTEFERLFIEMQKKHNNNTSAQGS